MKILAISDVRHGGAAVACRRLAVALRAATHHIVWATANGAVSTGAGGDELPVDLLGESVYRLAWRLKLPFTVRERIERWKSERSLVRLARRFRPDVIHLHNLHHNLMFDFTERLPGAMPIVWTLHDMWALTGYCCHSMGCRKFTSGCQGMCPQMGKWGVAFRAPESEYRRRDAFFRRNAHRLHLVCPSEWMLRNVKDRFGEGLCSSVIRNCLDLAVFAPIRPKDAVRRALGLPLDRPIIVTSAHWANDPLKGEGTLDKAIKLRLGASRADLLHVAVGERTGCSDGASHVRYTGLIRDESLMNLYYNAADVMILPTLVDNLPNTIAESLAAGTPCIASNVGGCPEMVVDGENGLLVEPGDPVALSKAIDRVLGMDPASAETMSVVCRARAEGMFAPGNVAQAYGKLYEDLSGSGAC